MGYEAKIFSNDASESPSQTIQDTIQSMREMRVRQTAAEELEAAQTAAIAGIGLRGHAARDAMARARTESLRRARAARWEAITRGAWRTRVYGATAHLPGAAEDGAETRTESQ
jgi:hypothetical protein